MKFGKYMFESFKEFQHVKKVAFANGVETLGEFEIYLKNNFSDKLIKG